MTKLNEIKDIKGARQNSKRLGRGIGSGKGKTCGRGMKGQKSRSGVAIKGFEGGQMPIYRRLPKRGFTNNNRIEYTELTIIRLSQLIESSGAKDSVTIDTKWLIEKGFIKRSDSRVKLLGSGSINTKVELHVSKITNGAKTIIEAAGGNVHLLEG